MSAREHFEDRLQARIAHLERELAASRQRTAAERRKRKRAEKRLAVYLGGSHIDTGADEALQPEEGP